MNITTKKTCKYFKIYINLVLHLSIKIDEYLGIQSWIDDNNLYRYNIEFYLKNGKGIVCEYDDRILWETILKEIDNNL